MANRKNYSSSIDAYMTGINSQAVALQNIEAALKSERNTPATDTFDARQRDKNIETLTTLRDKVKRNVDALNARIANADKKAAAEKAQREADKKAEVMAQLRRGFAGTDADFERLKDQLYDNHLLTQQSDFQRALDQGRASGVYRA